MRSRNLIILAALVVALGGFIFFVERHGPTTDELAERAGRIFPDLDEDAVVGVEIMSSGGPIRLALIGDQWRLTEPVDYPAEASVVESLIRAVAALDAERSLSLDELDLSDYGLEAPETGIALLDSAGRRFALAVGDAAPLGSNRAVRRGGDEEIVLTSGAFVAALEKGIDDWRSRDVIDLPERDLASVEIIAVEDRILAKQVNGRWQLEEPIADLADRDQMQSLISELNALRVSEFFPIDADPTGLGLDPPAFRVVLDPRDGAEDLILELSAADEDTATLVCRRNGVDLFRVPNSIGTRLSKAPVLWRSDAVWPFSSWDVATVEIANTTDEIVFREVDGGWRLDDDGEADGGEIRRRLNALADLTARDHDLVLPPTDVMGSVVLVLDDDKGAEGITYTFYAPMEAGGSAAVTVSTRANVMSVDAVSAETILDDLDRLRVPFEEPPTGE